jgi:hypothetical protein
MKDANTYVTSKQAEGAVANPFTYTREAAAREILAGV